MTLQEKYLQQLIGAKGCVLISDTNALTGKFFGFVVNQEAVINKVYSTKSGDNNTSKHIERIDLTGKAIMTGCFISAGLIGDNEVYFDSIQLTSGSIIAYYA